MRKGRASRTAQQNALFRALEARRRPQHRVADDRLARSFLPLEFRLLDEAARLPVARRLIEAFIDKRWPGPRPGLVVRTRLIDDLVAKSATQTEQVLFLGAGFDTRPYRLNVLENAKVYEVDHPDTQSKKRSRLISALGSVPERITFVPVDFGRDQLVPALAAAGFRSGQRSLVVWEGVTNYLSAEAVDATFRALAPLLAPTSPLVVTYIDRRMLEGSVDFVGAHRSAEHVRSVGEPYTFGFHPDELRSYLAERGFALELDEAVPDAAPRYGVQISGYAYYHVAVARKL
jgi:methyltransferase (TIGR00027 family)